MSVTSSVVGLAGGDCHAQARQSPPAFTPLQAPHISASPRTRGSSGCQDVRRPGDRRENRRVGLSSNKDPVPNILYNRDLKLCVRERARE